MPKAGSPSCVCVCARARVACVCVCEGEREGATERQTPGFRVSVRAGVRAVGLCASARSLLRGYYTVITCDITCVMMYTLYNPIYIIHYILPAVISCVFGSGAGREPAAPAWSDGRGPRASTCRAFVRVCLCAHECACMCRCMCMCVCVSECVCVCVRTRACDSVRARACVCMKSRMRAGGRACQRTFRARAIALPGSVFCWPPSDRCVMVNLLLVLRVEALTIALPHTVRSHDYAGRAVQEIRGVGIICNGSWMKE